jgi:hypothetical protein
MLLSATSLLSRRAAVAAGGKCVAPKKAKLQKREEQNKC